MISIIVPVYNVENYLKQCLDSIINQSYKNLQIILIDDGSCDSSGKICDEYALKDNRIEVVHQKNSGAAFARNIGIEKSKGDYIYFVDSDDYLNLKCFEIMVNNIFDCDIVQCGEYIFDSKAINKMDKIPIGMFNNISFMKIYLDNWCCALIHNKLFKRDVIKDRFYGGKVIDDEYFTYKCILNAKSIKIIDETLYYYRQRKSSLMRNKETIKFQNSDIVDFIYKRYLDLIIYPELRLEVTENLINTYHRILNDYYCTSSLVYNIKKIYVKIIFRCNNISILKSLVLAILKPTFLYLKNKQDFIINNEDNYYE
ncbi:glycosyltransferase family 2 protein [Thomasclavelia cocleata]|uniref:glycosyltransferase family 2 protein n=1 Tax=Thomasclavelia cocleata TaxID=69824 RepID=UPI00241D8E4C|nr:glycosyltransferase [Thomasclavelia cocleata]